MEIRQNKKKKNTMSAVEIRKDIELSIIQNKYSVGTQTPNMIQIPSITEMQKEYGVSKSTIQKVINSLDEDGIILRRVGVWGGCFVKPLVRERLLMKNKQCLREEITSVVKYALALELGKTDILELVEDVIQEVNEKENRLSK